ncbi:low-density lipoprotein receptor-related protein 8-like [Penaeus monodon]|uniref:low-density lipoprotein receptor-related protein 8-like n=1 Tax=Penaeus monodon TaxID=6687 RepID=UPI0018A7483A|nr:low-density lipoprotein receptor-related protein 8-like [Penaeus monodon]
MMVLKVLLAALLCISQVAATCPESEQIHCGTSDRCTRIRYICDGDNDCGDYSDEESAICGAWRNEYCERGSVRCRRMGDTNCVTISRYCELSDPPCEGDLDMRLCQVLNDCPETGARCHRSAVDQHSAPLPKRLPNQKSAPSLNLNQ